MDKPSYYFVVAAVTTAWLLLMGCKTIPVQNIVTCTNVKKDIVVHGPVTIPEGCIIFYDTKGQIHRICGGICGVK